MPDYEVPEPILNSPYEEPGEHWNIEEGEAPERRVGRRPAGYFYRDPKTPPSDDEHAARGVWQELTLVNLIRTRLREWRAQRYPNVTRTTLDLLNYWRRDGRQHRLFLRSLRRRKRSYFSPKRARISGRGLTFQLMSRATRAKLAASGLFNDTRLTWLLARARPPLWVCWPPGASLTR